MRAQTRLPKAVKCELLREVIQASASLSIEATGRSMLPAIWPGDILSIVPATIDDISEGDIVLLSRSHKFVAHRVIEKGGVTVTRGDAAPRPDPPVPARDLMGRVTHIVRRGKRIEPRRTPRLAQRAVAALVRNSEFAARVVVGVHGLLQTIQN